MFVVARVLRVVAMLLLFVVTLSLVIAVLQPATGQAEKAVLIAVAGGAVLLVARLRSNARQSATRTVRQ